MLFRSTNPRCYWRRILPLPVDFADASNTEGSSRTIRLYLDAAETRALLQEVPKAYRTQINDALLTALASTARTLLSAGTGALASVLGWPLFFLLTTVAALPALALLAILQRRGHFAALARAYGAHGETVVRTEEFAPAFERAVAAGRPSLLHVKVDPQAITMNASLDALRAQGEAANAKR